MGTLTTMRMMKTVKDSEVGEDVSKWPGIELGWVAPTTVERQGRTSSSNFMYATMHCHGPPRPQWNCFISHAASTWSSSRLWSMKMRMGGWWVRPQWKLPDNDNAVTTLGENTSTVSPWSSWSSHSSLLTPLFAPLSSNIVANMSSTHMISTQQLHTKLIFLDRE